MHSQVLLLHYYYSAKLSLLVQSMMCWAAAMLSVTVQCTLMCYLLPAAKAVSTAEHYVRASCNATQDDEVRFCVVFLPTSELALSVRCLVETTGALL